MDLARICAISFEDVVGTLLIGMALGATMLLLVQMATRERGE